MAKFWAETFPVWAGHLEKQLAKNPKGGGYFVGNSLTLADVAAFVAGERFLKTKPDCLNACPNWLSLVTKVANRPNIAAWCKKRPVE